MTQSVLYPKCLILAVTAALFSACPVFADKPPWAGNPKRGQVREEDHWQDRRDYSGRGRHDREKDQRNWSGERNYRGSHQRDRADWRDVSRDQDRNLPRYSGGRYFVDDHRTIVHNYYYEQYRGRRCPPGLAKKHNGCVPPGHARKWVIGRPLPRNVIFYDVPEPVVLGLGYPPPGYRFVRVASDILLIAIGSGMVMDAIYDLGGW